MRATPKSLAGSEDAPQCAIRQVRAFVRLAMRWDACQASCRNSVAIF
jgi:hypothetical protein